MGAIATPATDADVDELADAIVAAASAAPPPRRAERPMRTNLAPADLGDLLERPILAVLATRRRDETTMLSPVWFEWDGDAVVIWTGGPEDGKARHLAADPRTTVVIAESDLPYRGLEVTGRAELTQDGYDAAIRGSAPVTSARRPRSGSCGRSRAAS